MDQQKVDRETTDRCIRRSAFLCIHALSNVACFRAGCDVEGFHLHRHFFGRAHNNLLDAAIMKWCMLFADDRAKHRVFNLVSDMARFKQELLTH